MSVSLSITGYVQVSDSTTGIVALKKLFASLTASGTAFTEGQSISVGTSPVTVSLPVSPAQFLYVKNLHATNTLTVTWTPNGGSTATILLLEPGSAILFCEAATGSGITALSLTGSASATLCEYVVGG